MFIDKEYRYGLIHLWIKSQYGRIFHTCPSWPWGPHSLLHNGYWVLSRSKATRGVALNTHPHIMLMLKKE
jgi:hypothetical protein